MIYADATKQYAAYTAAHHTVNKTRQVVMLYDGVIRFVKQTKEAILTGNIESRYNYIEKACSVISGLQSSLDFEQGGTIAGLLDDYYFSIYMRLMSLHRSINPELCDQIIHELKMMRDAWEDVDHQFSHQDPLSSTNLSHVTPDPAQGETSLKVSI